MDTPASVKKPSIKAGQAFILDLKQEAFDDNSIKKRTHTALSGTPHQQCLLGALQDSTTRQACLQSFAVEKTTMASRKAA